LSSSKFQFLKGAIKRLKYLASFQVLTKFQFLKGAIKRGRAIESEMDYSVSIP